MSAFPKFDPFVYLQNRGVTPAKAANPANIGISLASLATLAASNPQTETLFAERAAMAQFDSGIPVEWAEALATLQTMAVPASIEAHAWPTVIDDAGCFLDRWTLQAIALGWTCGDVFGLHCAPPDEHLHCTGLVSLIGGWTVTAITADTVAMRSPAGLTLSFFKRRKSPAQVTVWECLP